MLAAAISAMIATLAALMLVLVWEWSAMMLAWAPPACIGLLAGWAAGKASADAGVGLIAGLLVAIALRGVLRTLACRTRR